MFLRNIYHQNQNNRGHFVTFLKAKSTASNIRTAASKHLLRAHMNHIFDIISIKQHARVVHTAQL